MAKKRARAQKLPEMEDTAIAPLESAAQEYVSIRDERTGLNQEEHTLKQKVLSLMKKHGKKRYLHDGIEIRVIAEDETVKVKVKKPKADD